MSQSCALSDFANKEVDMSSRSLIGANKIIHAKLLDLLSLIIEAFPFDLLSGGYSDVAYCFFGGGCHRILVLAVC